MLVGIGGIIFTFPMGLTVGFDSEVFWVTLAGFFLLFLDGYDKVADIEDELGSEASPNGDNEERHTEIYP